MAENIDPDAFHPTPPTFVRAFTPPKVGQVLDTSFKLRSLVLPQSSVISDVLLASRKQNTRVVNQTLQLLFNNEYLGLIAYTQCIIPVMYMVYMAALQTLPNRVFYPEARNVHDATLFVDRMLVIVLSAAFQFVSLLALHTIVASRFSVSTLYQIAFVLETHAALIQGKVASCFIFAVGFPLEHYANTKWTAVTAEPPPPFSIPPPYSLQHVDEGWQNADSPAMLESQKTNDKSLIASDGLKALRHDRELTRAALRVPLPMLYFIFYILVLVVHIPASGLYKQNNALSTTRAAAATQWSDSPMLFYNIKNMSDVFQWLELTLVPSVFVTQDYNSNDLPVGQWGRIALHNQVLGAIQLATTYGAQESCDNQKFLREIYPTYFNTEESVTNTTLMSLTLNSTDAVDYIKSLQESGSWLDDSTEALEVTIVTYNGEISSYGVTKLTLEFQEGGFIDLSSSSTGAISAPYLKTRAFVADATFGVCFVLVLAGQLMRLWQNRRHLGAHLKNFWHFVDYAATVLVVAFYVVWGLIVSTTSSSSFRTNIASFSSASADWASDDVMAESLASIISSLEHIGRLTTVLRILATVTILFLGIRILDTFRFHPRLNVLSHTISSSLHKFASFLVVFMIVVVTFALSGHFIFGDRADEFSSIKASLESCINILFGNFDYSAIEGLIVPVSIIYYWGYLIVSNLILLNMMLAIVLDTYEEVSEEAYNDKTITSMGRMTDELDSRDLSRREVVFRGRIRPDVLEAVLEALEHVAGEKEQTKTPLILTSLELQSMFFSAQVTDEEAEATIDYLLHGLLPLVDEDKDVEEERKLSKRQRKKQKRTASSARRASEEAALGEDRPCERFANTDVQQLNERLAALERKLELVLAHLESK
ncbi:hypothetical protein PRNP1_004405 [Phytophthora ramorum]